MYDFIFAVVIYTFYKSYTIEKKPVRKGALRNFAKFTEKHLCQSLRHEACNIIKKETRAQVFPCEFCEISKNLFFTEHLRVTASGNY